VTCRDTASCGFCFVDVLCIKTPNARLASPAYLICLARTIDLAFAFADAADGATIRYERNLGSRLSCHLKTNQVEIFDGASAATTFSSPWYLWFEPL